MSNDGKLSSFLREVSVWQWDDFVKAEKDMDSYSSKEGIVFALIRACAMRKLPAIKVAINRLDGKLKTPIKFEMPKVYYLYPNATPGVSEKLDNAMTVSHPLTAEQADKIVEGVEVELMPVAEPVEREENKVTEPDLPSLSFRETLTEMVEYPRSLPQQIADLAQQTEQYLRKQSERPPEIPMVKSVVAAHLLIMAQDRNLDAMTEVFDQIDGKLVEVFKVLGEDIYLTMFDDVAPPDAKLNADGILQVEAIASQNIWADKLGKGLK